MWILILTMTYLLAQHCSGIQFIDLPNPEEKSQEDPPKGGMRRNLYYRPNVHPPEEPFQEDYPKSDSDQNSRRYLHHKTKHTSKEAPRIDHWLFRNTEFDVNPVHDEKDSDIKKKINTLVQQTLHDTERKIKSISHLKESNRDRPPYRMGFILNMIKKSRDVLNELFNVAVKHRDQWMALEQLKIFELIVHTNVDTTNLVRQLVEIHIQYLNSTSGSGPGLRKRVVLL